MTKRFGFTLAEVLITLGIIGVVAAMSIPTLIANTNSAKFRSQFKKTVATLNQAALMSTAQFDYDFAGASEASDATKLNAQTNPSVAAMMGSTLAGVTITTGTSPYATEPTVTGSDKITTKYYAKLADGSMFVFNGAATGCTVEPGSDPAKYISSDTNSLATKGCVGWIDVNGASNPNAESACTEDGVSGFYTSNSTKCTVKNDAASTKDIYPVVFHDAVVEPATYAGRAILTTAK